MIDCNIKRILNFKNHSLLECILIVLSFCIPAQFIPKKKIWLPVWQLFDTPVMTRRHHVLCVLRYMAIKNYFNKNTDGWEYYTRLNARDNSKYGIPYDASKDRASFENLIKSMCDNGYLGEQNPSDISFDREVFNGTHRLAVCLYMADKWGGNVCVLKWWNIKRWRGIDTAEQQLEDHKLTEEERKRLELEYREMYTKCMWLKEQYYDRHRTLEDIK